VSKISVIVPCYNEEETIEAFYEAITGLWNELTAYELEVIFIDDGSKDRTYEMIRSIVNKDERFRFSSFSRNFGKESAIFCGLKQATGDAVVVIDADLQHPVATIPDMIKKWEEGYDIVEGIKSTRGKESKSHSFCAGLFYKIMSKMIGFDMDNTSDYKMMDRKVVDTLNSLNEKNTFFRALSFWVGYKSTSVEYEVQDRVAGTTKWNGRSLIKYAIYNITSFTYAPLHFITWAGVAVLIVGLILGIDAVVSYFKGLAVGGYPSLLIIVILSTGAIMLSLGIIALYISRIYEEIKNRPRYIVKDEK